MCWWIDRHGKRLWFWRENTDFIKVKWQLVPDIYKMYQRSMKASKFRETEHSGQPGLPTYSYELGVGATLHSVFQSYQAQSSCICIVSKNADVLPWRLLQLFTMLSFWYQSAKRYSPILESPTLLSILAINNTDQIQQHREFFQVKLQTKLESSFPISFNMSFRMRDTAHKLQSLCSLNGYLCCMTHWKFNCLSYCCLSAPQTLGTDV